MTSNVSTIKFSVTSYSSVHTMDEDKFNNTSLLGIGYVVQVVRSIKLPYMHAYIHMHHVHIMHHFI